MLREVSAILSQRVAAVVSEQFVRIRPPKAIEMSGSSPPAEEQLKSIEASIAKTTRHHPAPNEHAKSVVDLLEEKRLSLGELRDTRDTQGRAWKTAVADAFARGASETACGDSEEP